MNLLIKGIKGCWNYFWGHVFALLYYDKKYLTGKYFTGKMNGLCSPGWEWVVRDGFARLLFGINRASRFPVSFRINVICPENIHFHPDDINNFQGFGNYYQAIGKITIGKGTWIAPNVGLITSNHDIIDPDKHVSAKPIQIGEHCWIGMNSMILGGVTLGNHTTVGAGSVVTKSFPEGNCVIVGNPAKIIKRL